MKVVVVDDKDETSYDLRGRSVKLLRWLLARAELIAASERGNIQIDYGPKDWKAKWLEVTEAQVQLNSDN